VYLAPFEACVAEAGVFLIMAAYNSVNGATMTANAPLVRGVLKGEWEFTGAVVSDWSATTSTIASAVGGLDLVMPGPEGPWGEKLVEAVRAGAVAESDIDAEVTVNQGALTSAMVAIPPAGTLHDPVSGKPGVRLELRDADGTVVYDDPHPTSVLTWWDGLPGDLHLHASEIVMRTRYRAQV